MVLIVDFDSSNSENVFYKASTTRVETFWSKSNVYYYCLNVSDVNSLINNSGQVVDLLWWFYCKRTQVPFELSSRFPTVFFIYLNRFLVAVVCGSHQLQHTKQVTPDDKYPLTVYRKRLSADLQLLYIQSTSVSSSLPMFFAPDQ